MLPTLVVLSELGFSIVQMVFVAFPVLRTSNPVETKEKLMVLRNVAGFLLRERSASQTGVSVG